LTNRIGVYNRVMKNKLSLKKYQEFLKEMLSNNGNWALRALQVIASNQTAEERSSENTIEKNGVGFTGIDGEIGMSLAKQSETRNLSEKQMRLVHKIVCKYWKQLLEVSDMDKLNDMVEKYNAGEYPIVNTLPTRKTESSIPHSPSTISISGCKRYIVISNKFNRAVNTALYCNDTYAKYHPSSHTRRIDIDNAVKENRLVQVLRYLQLDFVRQFPAFVISAEIVALDKKVSL
jgi:hypothetical protein